jgi:hypothetical protein
MKMYKYQNCKSARRERRIKKIKRWSFNIVFIFTLTASIMAINSYLSLVEDIKGQSTNHSIISPVNAIVGEIKPTDIKDESLKYLQSRGFTDEQLFNFKCLMNKENKTYDPYAIYVNKNGSYDRGLLMWNSKTAPIKISNECTFDYMCSLEKFADYILNGGDWNRWFGYKNYCN